MNINIRKGHPDAVIPTYGTEGAACFDITAVEGGLLNPTFIAATGLYFEIPKEHVMLVFSRSGMGFKDDVRLSNCVGVIDSDYRGELKVKLKADGDRKQCTKGDRIAQGIVLPYKQVQFILADKLDDTQRGAGGYGSTGK
jgi:dUTP pyrophosphatase